MLGVVKAFWRDERGVALILVSIMLPAIIGFALLAIDMSRANNLHNDLQKAADAFAIAAAAELNGAPDAHTRAINAVATLVDNTYRFSDAGAQQVLDSAGISPPLFLRGIPPSDATFLNPLTGVDANGVNWTSAGPAQTEFVLINVLPTGFQAIFPASFLSGDADDNAFEVGATAVAGFNSAVCDFTPVFICNPYETPSSVGGITLQQAVAERQYRRRLIELRSVGNGAAAFPGNFGFLASQGGNGAKALAEMIATSRPGNCYSTRGVDTKTGQNSGPVKGAFNIRFGLQEPGANWNGAEFGPAQNVRKGAVKTTGNQNQCSASNQFTWGPPNQGLTPDTCFSSSCPYMGGKMGDGDWNFSGYWSTNHGSTAYPSDWSTSGPDKPTRYEVYRYEVTHNGGALIADVSAGGERGTPPSMCGTPVTSVDRRLLYGAIVNCQGLADAGYKLGGQETGIPVEAFASFFLTEPVTKNPDSPSDASVFVELVDITGAAGQGTLNNFLRNDVQLYR